MAYTESQAQPLCLPGQHAAVVPTQHLGGYPEVTDGRGRTQGLDHEEGGEQHGAGRVDDARRCMHGAGGAQTPILCMAEGP